MAVERIRIRRDTAANWTSENPTLGLGELGLETDTQRMKIGDGATAWNSLDYLSLEPPGRLAPFAMATAPGGYLECDGDEVSRTTYAALFAAIGTTWGAGDSSTTFNLPDLRGMGVRGAGSHDSETKADGSAYEGPAVGSYEDDQMQGHHHEFYYSTASSSQAGGEIPGDIVTRLSTSISLNDTVREAITDGTNGPPNVGTETRGAAAGVLWCIKT